MIRITIRFALITRKVRNTMNRACSTSNGCSWPRKLTLAKRSSEQLILFIAGATRCLPAFRSITTTTLYFPSAHSSESAVNSSRPGSRFLPSRPLLSYRHISSVRLLQYAEEAGLPCRTSFHDRRR
uniref:(northern house mosquito) hypothetical protein n=1 Tax=Culex pipiens TaxID=7175 RepID=A0A8D8F5Z0_CULPI